MPETKYGAPLQIQDLKAAGDAWTVSGYASTFGNVDEGGDVVVRGAFDQTLGQRKVRFLYGHDPRQVLGVPEDLKSDDKGLFGRFRISRTRLGEEVHQLLKDKALDSFSIGYIPTDVEYDDEGDVRKLKAVDLLEVSVVAMPMNERALVTAVKAEDARTLPFTELWERITESLKVGTAEAKALRERRASRPSGWKGLSDAHVEALRTGVAEARALLAEVEALVTSGADPEQAKAAGIGAELLRRRLRDARVRLTAAGILESPTA